MSDFETPIIRDISRLLTQLAIGSLIAFAGIMIFVFPFHLTVYGDHCSMTTSYSIAKWILESLTIEC